MLPPVMLGSLTAIVLAGVLNHVGKLYPHLTGEGRLQPGERDHAGLANAGQTGPVRSGPVLPDITAVGAALVLAVALYLVGVLGQRLFEFPAPVTMLFPAVAFKLGRVVPPDLEAGAHRVYRFFQVGVTYPLLFAIGVAMTPWDKLMLSFQVQNVVTIVATVASMMATGFVVGRLMRMYPIETAIVNACHSGQGGTGDVAILTAANRMQLMPFAQIATRIGGAIVVTLTLIALARLA